MAHDSKRPPAPSDLTGVLLTLDHGLLARVDHEVAILARASKEKASKVQSFTRRVTLRKRRIAGHAVTRLEVLRELIRESLDRRATARGEEVPSVEVAGPFESAPSRTETEIVAALEPEPEARPSDFLIGVDFGTEAQPETDLDVSSGAQELAYRSLALGLSGLGFSGGLKKEGPTANLRPIGLRQKPKK